MKNIGIIFVILIVFTLYAYFGFGDERVVKIDDINEETAIINVTQ